MYSAKNETIGSQSPQTHTVKDLVSLTVTIILTQIRKAISLMQQSISSIVSIRCCSLLHLICDSVYPNFTVVMLHNIVQQAVSLFLY